MKVLILADNLEVNRTSSGITCNNQIYAYVKYFDKVNVVTATHLDQFKQLENVDYKVIRENKKTFFENLPRISALPAYVTGLNFTGKRIVESWKAEIVNKLKNDNYDLVVSLGSGSRFYTSYAMIEINKELYGKYLMFIHDPYPIDQYPPPYQKKSTYLTKMQSGLFGDAIKKADIVSFPSHRLMEWMSQYYSFIKNKYIIQPHLGSSLEELENILPHQIQTTIPEFNNGVDIVHTGTLLGPRNPHYLIKALNHLFKDYPESKEIIHLHIIGKMTRDWDENEFTTPNVHVYSKRYTYHESLLIQRKADVLLLLEAVSEVSPFMPGKLADYLVANKPILALTPKKSETTRILGNQYKLIVENGNESQIYKKLKIIYKKHQKKELNKLSPSIDSIKPDNWYKQLMNRF